MIVERHPEKRLLMVHNATKLVSELAVRTAGGVAYMPHDMHAERILYSEGATDVPSVIQDYSWPGMFAPYEHQKGMVKFLLRHPRGWNLSGMRTGKTAASVWSADIMMRFGVIKRVLVLCPLSVIHDAWTNALTGIVPNRDIDIAVGASAKAAAALQSGAEFVVANHDKVKHNYEQMLAYNPDLIIIDESAAFKNYSAERYKALRSLINKCRPRIQALTATPAAQAPTDPWTMARLIKRDSVPSKWRNFRAQTMVEVGPNIWRKREGWEDVVLAALQPSIRYRTQDCITMPQVAEITRHTPMGAKQTKAYRQMEKYGVLQVDEGIITAANAAVAINKLRQITCGILYDRQGDSIEIDASTKLSELLSIVDESEGKIIVFAPFRNITKWLVYKLNSKGVTAVRLDRSDSLVTRTEVFNSFQNDPDPRVLVMHPQIAKYGLTLTAANTTVWWGPVFSNETYQQANMRMMGPKEHKCAVVMLHANAMEHRLYTSLMSEDDVHTALIDEYRTVVER